jgi:hypothetical protein
MNDGETLFEKEITTILPLGTRTYFNLKYKEELDCDIFCCAYEYFYDMINNVLDIRFTDDNEHFELSDKNIAILYDIITSDDFDPTQFKLKHLE